MDFGPCWHGCPSWPQDVRACRIFWRTTGWNTEGTTSPGISQCLFWSSGATQEYNATSRRKWTYTQGQGLKTKIYGTKVTSSGPCAPLYPSSFFEYLIFRGSGLYLYNTTLYPSGNPFWTIDSAFNKNADCDIMAVFFPTRYDYESIDIDTACEMMEDLEIIITDKSFVKQRFAVEDKLYQVEKADSFEYTDPVNSSLTRNQVTPHTLSWSPTFSPPPYTFGGSFHITSSSCHFTQHVLCSSNFRACVSSSLTVHESSTDLAGRASMGRRFKST